MEYLNDILKLDTQFINLYSDIIIDDENIDNFIKVVEDYDNNREKFIKNININDLRKILSNEDIHKYIIALRDNLNKVNDIIKNAQTFCEKNLRVTNKDKKLNIYNNLYSYTESNFINVIK